MWKMTIDSICLLVKTLNLFFNNLATGLISKIDWFNAWTGLILTEIYKNLTDIEFDENENNIVRDMIKNSKICRHLYRPLYTSVSYNFLEFV